jgi:hypothetical protein
MTDFLQGSQNSDLVVQSQIVELCAAFNQLTHKIMQNSSPDIIDIIFIIKADGKTQTITLTKFLKKIETLIGFKVGQRLPTIDTQSLNIKPRLHHFVDTFVGESAGSILATAAALGKSLDEVMSVLISEKSKLLVPSQLETTCACIRFFKQLLSLCLSEQFDIQMQTSEDSGNLSSLSYDQFKSLEFLSSLFGASSTSDLRTCCETIGAMRNNDLGNDNLAAINESAVRNADNNAKQNVRRATVTEVLENFMAVVPEIAKVAGASVGSVEQTRADEFLAAFQQLVITPKKSANRHYCPFFELRDRLINRNVIPRDLLIISLSSGTYDGELIIPRANYSVKHTLNGPQIINLDFNFVLPHELYKPQKYQDTLARIDKAINGVFPSDGQTDLQNLAFVQATTQLLSDFLASCTGRTVLEFYPHATMPVTLLQNNFQSGNSSSSAASSTLSTTYILGDPGSSQSLSTLDETSREVASNGSSRKSGISTDNSADHRRSVGSQILEAKSTSSFNTSNATYSTENSGSPTNSKTVPDLQQNDKIIEIPQLSPLLIAGLNHSTSTIGEWLADRDHIQQEFLHTVSNFTINQTLSSVLASSLSTTVEHSANSGRLRSASVSAPHTYSIHEPRRRASISANMVTIGVEDKITSKKSAM